METIKNSLQTKEQTLFQKFYKNKTLLIKVSGTEIATPEFQQTTRDIKALIADQIKVLLIFGGGNQIDSHWEKNGNKFPRPKHNGIAITSEKVFYEAVQPAYTEIIEKLKSAFCNTQNSQFIHPSELNAIFKDYNQWGYTGTPVAIDLDFDKALNVIGFVGGTKTGEVLNINADEIVTLLIQQYQQKINEVIFATQTGGVLNQQGEIVPLLTRENLEKILQGKHPQIQVTQGMQKKLEEIKSLLDLTPKIAITNTTGIYNEITQLYGSGTLCINLEQAQIQPLSSPELFQTAYKYNVASGDWKTRSPEEQMQLMENHFVLFVKNSPLGGFSLSNQKCPLTQKEALCLECWWSSDQGNGIGSKLLEIAIEKAKSLQQDLFLYTKNDLTKFNSAFQKHLEYLSPMGNPLWTILI